MILQSNLITIIGIHTSLVNSFTLVGALGVIHTPGRDLTNHPVGKIAKKNGQRYDLLSLYFVFFVSLLINVS